MVFEQKIIGTGYYLPDDVITNDELVASFNKYVRSQEDFDGDRKKLSDAQFIEKASGIGARHVVDKSGILNVERMRPKIVTRKKDQLSFQAEFSIAACKQAISQAGINEQEIDAVIVSCSNLQRAYPGIAIEIKQALGIKHGWAVDMNAGCSSAVFGIGMAVSSLKQNLAQKVLVVNPELYTTHLNFRDRRSHFIFGDGCSAVVVENSNPESNKEGFRIKDVALLSKFSNNIRNDFGFLNQCEDEFGLHPDHLFNQVGKNVREQVVPLTVDHLIKQCERLSLSRDKIKRLWLHQANSHINRNIASSFFDREVHNDDSPIHLDQYANTGSSGVIISFHNNKDDFCNNELGVICAFGAGYSLGSVIVQKVGAN